MTTVAHDALDLLLRERPWLRPTYGLYINSGWRPIAASALREIALVAERSDAAVEILQVKEKFGRFRISFQAPDDVRPSLKDILLRAEQEAAVTCDLCGAPGLLRGPMWWRTRCDSHIDS